MPKKITPEYSIKILYPFLEKEWEYKLNNGIDINTVSKNSHILAWWKCSKNHVYQAKIYSRTNGTGCPYCANRKVLTGFNDLESCFPEIAKEYSPKNIKAARDQLAHSHKKVLWICEKGHEYEASIGQRTEKQTQCPYCKGNLPIKGKNDLQTLFPSVAAEWDYDINKKNPSDYSAHSNKKVAWKCVYGHRWNAVINSRTFGKKCPYCSGRIAIKGLTDLQTKFPLVAQEWAYEENYPLTPDDICYQSNKSVFWRCRKKNHLWKSTVYNRINKNLICPYCTGRYPIIGETDLATLNPYLAEEWNYKKNKKKPQDYTLKSNKKVWWQCESGHEWRMTISERTTKGLGCSICYNLRTHTKE